MFIDISSLLFPVLEPQRVMLVLVTPANIAHGALMHHRLTLQLIVAAVGVSVNPQ